MRQFVLHFLPVLFLLFLSCGDENQTENINETAYFEYPAPFYLQNKGAEIQMVLGVSTHRFTYAECNNEPWLLYDKYIDSEVNVNMVNSDEYTFIQLDLKVKLQNQILNSENNPFLQEYSFYRSNCFRAR